VRCVLVGVVVVALCAMCAVPASAATSGDAAGAPNGPFVVSVPRGWYVRGATLPAPQTFEQSFPLYARPGHLDPAHDALLSTGFQGDGDVDQLLGKKTPVPDLGENGLAGQLVRNGDWAWVTWSAVGGVDPLVAAHGLTDNQVIAAARATTVDPEGRDGPTIAKSGLPSGFDELAREPIGPDYGPPTAEQITLVKADGTSVISMRVIQAGARARAMVQFWAAQRALRGDPGSDQRRINRAAVRARGDTVIVASGPTSQSTLTKIVGSAKSVDDAAWQAFRRRVLELPVSALVVSTPVRDAVVLDGRTATTRWAISIDPSGMTFAMVVTADGSSGLGGGGASAPDLTRPIVTLSGYSTAGPGFSGMFVVGAAPVATSTVRLQAGSAAPFEAVLGPPGPDSRHRYFSAFVDDVAGKVAAVALDAAGHEIARKSDMGCIACP
jgi:hypothetical protein